VGSAVHVLPNSNKNSSAVKMGVWSDASAITGRQGADTVPQPYTISTIRRDAPANAPERQAK
jgi:hypothetical protein